MKEYAEEVKKCVEVMRSNGSILYPTDTIWGLGCDATSALGIKKLISLKKRHESKSFIILLDNESRLLSYIKEVPEQAWMLIEHSDKPLTIIFDGARNLPEELIAEDGSIAIRITHDDFCRDLIASLKKPLVSTSANISGEPSPSTFREVDEKIINGVDYTVKWRQNDVTPAKPSTIIRLRANGQIEFIRR